MQLAWCRVIDGTLDRHENMIVVLPVQDEEDRTVDTGAKPGHAMLPDMGFYHLCYE